MASTPLTAELRGVVLLDQLQPQFAATIASNSEGYFPIAGECALWLEVCPGIVISSLLDIALKSCEVRPGAMITERSYGTLEVHGPDQGQVRMACELILSELGLRPDDGLRPTILTSRIIHKIDDHQAMMINRTRNGMLLLGGDTLYTLEVTPAVHALYAANEAEKASSVRLVDLQNNGAVGRLQLAGSDSDIEQAVVAVERALGSVRGRPSPGESR
ncbi:MAG: ethanolamine utilization microcompartment shell protein EutS [Candidatus Paceibacteria bacterium]|jgi:ethanolamine utilization microcompartment shell protein EutS